ncbi:MAG TPA: hypothetical protein VML94_08775 [Thermoplasmata archaeon]|nr:hypothetical protein [Thermoplasmata archaeon]
MADPAPRRVRLARPPALANEPPTTPAPAEDDAGSLPLPGVRRVVNRAATQRARRLALLYLAVLAALYLGLAVLARSSHGGGTAGTSQDLELFGAVAFAFALVGVFLALLSAPASVEWTPTATVLVSVLGTRRVYPALPGISVRIARRFPPGVLSSEPVESVEIGARGVRRTYLFDAGVFTDTHP